MIRYFYKNIRSKGLKELESYKKGSWIYVEAPNEEEVEHLVQTFKLEPGHIEDALDMDEMPRLEREGDLVYIYTRYATTDDELHITTAPLLFVVGEDTLITISPQQMPRLQKFMDEKVPFNTTQRTKLVLQILDQIVDQYEAHLNNIGKQIKAIRARLRVEQIRNRDFVNFVLIEDELNEFMSALTPTNAILRRILLGKHLKLYDDDEDLVQDLLLNNEQSIEAARSSIKSIINIREAYSTIMANNLNAVIRVLTILTVIISVPTFIASVYGMNVTLPYQDDSLAFAGVMMFSLLISLFLLVVFKQKRWL